MNEQMKRFESRYIVVGEYKVKFSWYSKSNKLITVSVLKEVDGIFGKRYKKVYSDTIYTYAVLTYELTAKHAVESYEYELSKWDSLTKLS